MGGGGGQRPRRVGEGTAEPVPSRQHAVGDARWPRGGGRRGRLAQRLVLGGRGGRGGHRSVRGQARRHAIRVARPDADTLSPIHLSDPTRPY